MAKIVRRKPAAKVLRRPAAADKRAGRTRPGSTTLRKPAAAAGPTESGLSMRPGEKSRIQKEVATMGCSLVAVLEDPPLTGCFVYSTGFTSSERPELLARCGESLMQEAGATINFLAKRTRDGHAVEGGQNVMSCGILWQTRRLAGKALHGANKDCMMRSRAFYQKPVEVIELKPIPEMGDKLVVGEAAGRDADRFRKNIRAAIWKNAQEGLRQPPGVFIRFVDGNTRNCCVDNLKQVHVAEALRHPDWKVDWDMELSKAEADFVRSYAGRVPNVYTAFQA